MNSIRGRGNRYLLLTYGPAISDKTLSELQPCSDCSSPREKHGLTKVFGPSYHGNALRKIMVRNALSFESLEAGLFDSARHYETLALLASAALIAERPGQAFMFADRRCRNPAPTARDYLLRAEASRRAGYGDYAANDLRRALEIDPVDDLVNCSALTWGTGNLRSLAAANFLAGELEDRQTLVLALQALKTAGTRVITRLRWREATFAGWALWKDDAKLELHLRRGSEDAAFRLEPDCNHPLAGSGWCAAAISIEDGSLELELVGFRLDGRIRNADLPADATETEPRTIDFIVRPSRFTSSKIDWRRCHCAGL